MMFAVLLNVGLALMRPPGLPWSMIAIPIYTLGMALAAPSMSLFGLDLFPERRGLASSCQSFMQTGVNSLVAGVLAPMLWGSTLTLALGTGLFLALSLLALRAPGQGRLH